MKKFFVWMAVGMLLAFWSSVALAQPDPLDSIILESKAVAPGQYAGPMTDTAAYLYVKLSITNKDSLTFVTFAGVQRTLTGGAYATIGRPRNFNGLFGRLTSTLTGQNVFNIGQPPQQPGARYNSVSPDSFLVAPGFDPNDALTIEPPNLLRKAFLEIKFESVTVVAPAGGTFEIDTGRVVQNTQFTTVTPLDIPVNFMKAIITVGPLDVRDVNPGQRPQSYSLSQNYPNPFNANTQISFALPKAGKTKLEVFNILGQKVNTLVDEYMNAGYKIVNWDGRDNRGMEVPSGIYFYRLRSEDFLQTKKMLMIQ